MSNKKGTKINSSRVEPISKTKTTATKTTATKTTAPKTTATKTTAPKTTATKTTATKTTATKTTATKITTATKTTATKPQVKYELEARLGKKKDSGFQLGVTCEMFRELARRATEHKCFQNAETTITYDLAIEDDSGRNIRVTLNEKEELVDVIHKEKLSSEELEDCIVTLSKETQLRGKRTVASEFGKPDFSSNDKLLSKRKKTRFTFTFSSPTQCKLDLTVTQQVKRGGEKLARLEAEVEVSSTVIKPNDTHKGIILDMVSYLMGGIKRKRKVPRINKT